MSIFHLILKLIKLYIFYVFNIYQIYFLNVGDSINLFHFDSFNLILQGSPFLQSPVLLSSEGKQNAALSKCLITTVHKADYKLITEAPAS